jgi:SAM-dependent methyltransferase
VAPYNRGFREFSAAFESIGFERLHRGALAFLPAQPGLALDVGAGSGRDARWLADQGWEVVAVEPAAAMRDAARAAHPDSAVRWIDDRLPALAGVHRLGLAFDLVWLSGVWMHVPPDDRKRAMRKLATLLKPGGRLVMTLRHGPAADDRPMWPVDAHEVERLGLDFGLTLRVATELADDLQGRPDVRWQTVILDLPDDGAGALPLLRGVILRQEKSATYKLALLRCIARIADASANVAREAEDHVEVPLGLVALYWIRMYKPLVEQGLPQRPGVTMGFVTDAFRALKDIAPFDLRPGGMFGEALRRALGDASRLIATMPATHLTFADNSPVFPTAYRALPGNGEFSSITLDMLWRYGVTRVPLAVWQALRRMAAWIEPMLVAEWLRLTKEYAARQGAEVSADVVLNALRWTEPERDTNLVRGLALRRLEAGRPVSCVWSGRTLATEAFDIDHCLPWSAWACGDLWNLLPAARVVNQRQKRDLIISAAMLNEAKPRILNWWQEGYLASTPALRERFTEEARTTLPIKRDSVLDLEDLFMALDFRRLRLRQETQMAEWSHGSG